MQHRLQHENRSPLLWLLAAAGLSVLAGCGGGGGGDSGMSAPPPMPPPTDPQFRASAATPFAAGCDGVAANGQLFPDAEVEPYLAVNPQAAANLIGIWQQDRWSTGGARGFVTGTSFDGGLTWSQHLVPSSRCAGGNAGNGGDYSRVSNPWVTIAPDGTAYQIGIAFDGFALVPGSDSAILVSRSTDGGRSWSNPVTLIRDGDQFFNDKDSITADPTDSHYVYATWDRLTAPTVNTGPTYFSRTVDGGITWEPARAIYDPGVAMQTINNQIVVLPDGTLVLFFDRLNNASSNLDAALVVLRSVDKGVTWSAPIVLSQILPVGTRDPDTGRPIRDQSIIGSIAAGRNGTLAAVWQDSRFSGGARDGIAFSRSTDGGLTWSVPVAINGVPSVPAFNPAVHVRDDGTIGVTYYDFRNNTATGATLPTDYWLTRSSDGVTWREIHVAGSFDLDNAPVTNSPFAGGLFLGDYQGLTSIGALFVTLYAQTNTGDASNRTDIFSTLANLATAALSGTMGQSAPPTAGAISGESEIQAQAVETQPMSIENRQRVQENIARAARSRLPAAE